MELKQKHMPVVALALVVLLVLVGAGGYFAGRMTTAEELLRSKENKIEALQATKATTKAPTTIATTTAPTTTAPTTTETTTATTTTTVATETTTVATEVTTVAPTETTVATEATTVAPTDATGVAIPEIPIVNVSDKAGAFIDAFTANFTAGGYTLTYDPQYKAILDEIFLKAIKEGGQQVPGIRNYVHMKIQEDGRIPLKYSDLIYKEPGHVWTAEDGAALAQQALLTGQNEIYTYSIMDSGDGSICFVCYIKE